MIRSLIEWESPSGQEARAVGGIRHLMRDLGIPAVTQRVGDRANILSGPLRRDPELLFISHVDTVPSSVTGSRFSEVGGDKVCGPGACDAKGSIVAMLLAYRELARSPEFADKVALALVVGEETTGDGGEGLFRSEMKPKYAIVGEPTGLAVPWGQAGYLQMQLEVRGSSRHAFAAHGSSAMDRLVDSVVALRRLVDDMGKALPPEERPYMFIQRMNGGSSDKLWYLRKECSVLVNVNIHPSWDPEDFVARSKVIIDSQNDGSEGIDMLLSVLDSDPGVSFQSTELMNAVRTALQENGLPAPYSYMRSWTDAATLEWHGVKAVVVGPGSLDVAHSAEECVSVSEVDTAARVYAGAARHLLLETDRA